MYDIDYQENMLRMYSKSAEQIARIRWDWIEDINPKVVLDYGSGIGWFRAWRPRGIEVYSYDVGPGLQTGIGEARIYDCLCLWDCLEHIPDFNILEPFFRLSNHIACTVPIVSEKINLVNWKHFKPGEHLHYWTIETLGAFFEKNGFWLIKTGEPECPPRKDISSFLFGRI